MKQSHFYFLAGLGFVFLALIAPDFHDYDTYVKQWKTIFDGNDPYIGTRNTYGLTYNLFSVFSFFKLSIPKAIFVFTYLFSGFLLWKMSIEKNVNESNILLAIVLLNPVFLIFGVTFGSNDAFLTGMTITAIYFFWKEKFILSGILFSIAIAFKFIPLLIIPFFIFNNWKINYKLLLSCFLTLIVIYIVGYYVWGDTIFHPFLAGVTRHSKILSIFRFLRGSYSPLQYFNITNLDYLSIYFMVSSLFITFALYVIYKFDRYIMAFLAYSNVILFYKVGHHQFYLLLIMLSLFAYIQNYDRIQKNASFIKSYIIFSLWIFLCVFLYDYTEYGGRYRFIRDIIGAPTFLIHITSTILLIIYLFKNRFKKDTDEVREYS